jgi:hypothetical protein
MLPEREKQICDRLRLFRETLQIPRERFALSIGVTGARLQSYEMGRAPVRYETFAAVTRQFKLNPFWLATGQTAQALSAPFDDSRFQSIIRPRMLFSQAWDAIFESTGSPVRALTLAQEITAILQRLNDLMREEKDSGVIEKLMVAQTALFSLVKPIQDVLSQNQARRDTIKATIETPPLKHKTTRDKSS